VTGYEFLTDSSTAVKNQLALGTGVTPDSLINDTWTADQLRPKLLGAPKKDIVYLAGHFDAGVAYAADTTTTVSATELIPASVNMTNTLVFSTGCHAGYNVVDADGISGVTPPDWAQVLAGKGATLVAGTGFGLWIVLEDLKTAISERGGVGFSPHLGGWDNVADLFLTARAVFEVQQQPVESGRGAHLGGQRGRGAQEGAEGGVAGPNGPGQRTVVQRTGKGGAHPSHRCV